MVKHSRTMATYPRSKQAGKGKTALPITAHNQTTKARPGRRDEVSSWDPAESAWALRADIPVQGSITGPFGYKASQSGWLDVRMQETVWVECHSLISLSRG